jgi:ubiquinone/menaquinone biosynthesis C-methylase UbiE
MKKNDIEKEKIPQQYKEVLKTTFNAAEGYDGYALRFFKESAKFFVSCLTLNGNEQVLDIATGTGHLALALAGRLPRGHVTAVDFSKGMLDLAGKKSLSMNLQNITFLEMDMQVLDFGNTKFDAAICAFGIFFVDDMDAQLKRILNVVRPGGQIAICSFQENYFQPLRDRAVNRLIGYGVQPPPPLWKYIAAEEQCKEFFAKAGIKNVRVEKANMGYFLKSENEWWEIIWNTGMRRMLAQLNPKNLEKFRQEHLREIADLAIKDGIWLNTEVLYTIGIK